MTKTQFRDALERLGLTQGQAAERMGYTIKMVNNYANGREPIPLVVSSLVESWLNHGLPKS